MLAAVGSYLDARLHGGHWLVRIEDLDTPRVVPGSATDILRTLETLNLFWDGDVTYQSTRLAYYEAALGQLQQATMWLMQNGMKNPDDAGAASNDYMHLFGLTALAFMWARIAKAVLARQAAGTSDATLDSKLTLAKFFAARVLPEAGACLARLSSGAETLMALPAAAF